MWWHGSCSAWSVRTPLKLPRRFEGLLDGISVTPGEVSDNHHVLDVPRTPGRVVMVLQEGSCWIRRDDGSREDLTAKSVVIWEPGEWVEYGGDNGEGYTIESYWAQDLSEDEWKAIFARGLRAGCRRVTRDMR